MPGKPEATSVAKSLGKEPLEKGGQEWRGDLDGAHHERRTEAASLRHTERSGKPSTPAHRGADEGPKPTKASLKPSIKARPRGYVPHHSSMRHQGDAR